MAGVWALRTGDGRHNLLVVSFVDQTGFLAINNEEAYAHQCICDTHRAQLEGQQVAGAESGSATLHCGNVAHGQWVQVTEASARLITGATGVLAATWAAAAGPAISVAASSQHAVVLACGATLHVLDVAAGALTLARLGSLRE